MCNQYLKKDKIIFNICGEWIGKYQIEECEVVVYFINFCNSINLWGPIIFLPFRGGTRPRS